jgi:hypothetical protein
VEGGHGGGRAGPASPPPLPHVRVRFPCAASPFPTVCAALFTRPFALSVPTPWCRPHPTLSCACAEVLERACPFSARRGVFGLV